MPKKYFVARAKKEDYSLNHYATRIKRDSYLHDGVVDFVSKRDISLDNLVGKLINNHFSAKWQTDL